MFFPLTLAPPPRAPHFSFRPRATAAHFIICVISHWLFPSRMWAHDERDQTCFILHCVSVSGSVYVKREVPNKCLQNELTCWMDWLSKEVRLRGWFPNSGFFLSWIYWPGFVQLPHSLLIQSPFFNLFWMSFPMPTKGVDSKTQTDAILQARRPFEEDNKSRVSTMSSICYHWNVKIQSIITRHAKKEEKVTYDQGKGAINRNRSQDVCDVRFRKSKCQNLKVPNL